MTDTKSEPSVWEKEYERKREERNRERKERHSHGRSARTAFLAGRKAIDEKVFAARQKTVAAQLVEATHHVLLPPLADLILGYVPYDRWLRPLSLEELRTNHEKPKQWTRRLESKEIQGWMKQQCVDIPVSFQWVRDWSVVCSMEPASRCLIEAASVPEHASGSEREVTKDWAKMAKINIPILLPKKHVPRNDIIHDVSGGQLGELHSVLGCEEPLEEDAHDFGNPANILVTIRRKQEAKTETKTPVAQSLALQDKIIGSPDRASDPTLFYTIVRVPFPTNRVCREQRPAWDAEKQLVWMLESQYDCDPHFESRTSAYFGVDPYTHQVVDCIMWHQSYPSRETNWWQGGFVHHILSSHYSQPRTYNGASGRVRHCGGDEDVSGPGIYFTDSCRRPRLILLVLIRGHEPTKSILEGRLTDTQIEKCSVPIVLHHDVLYDGHSAEHCVVGYRLEWLLGNGVDIANASRYAPMSSLPLAVNQPVNRNNDCPIDQPRPIFAQRLLRKS